MKAPTKAEELAALDKFINSYPDDSYLKGWLLSVRNEVESAIRSDVFPQVSLAETDRQCKRRLEECNAAVEQRKLNAQRELDAKRVEAQRQHDAVLAEAENIAARLRDEASRKRAEVRNTLYGLRCLLNSLED